MASISPPALDGATCNFKSHKWWGLHWKRRTRTEAFNILDDKMRVAGAVALQKRILEIVEEFGIDYFRKGLRETIERERRVPVQRIRTQAVPVIPSYPLQGKTPPKKAYKRQREAFMDGKWTRCGTWEQDLLEPGNRVDGPAIIEHTQTTFVIPSPNYIELDKYRFMRCKRKG